MSDTEAPTLTGLTLPSVIDLGAGAATITYFASASDNVGVASVWITYDRQIVGSAGPSSTWLMREEFGEDFTAAPISRDLVISDANTPGAVTVVDVTVYDDAGNSTSYTTSELQGLGFPTGFTLTDAVPDTVAPELTGLTLPGTVDVTNGDVAVSYSVSATDDRGVDGVWLTFERPASGTNPAANRWFVFDGAGEDWSAGPLTRTIDIRDDTVPGNVVLYSVSVFDEAGNMAVYQRPDLIDLGVPIEFAVVNDAVSADFGITADVTADGLVLSVDRDGTSLAAPLLGLVLRLDAAGAGTPVADLVPAGSISETVEVEGQAQVLRVMADVTGTVQDGETVLTVTLPVPAGAEVDVSVLGIEVDGVLSVLPDPPRVLAGTTGDDMLAFAGSEPAKLVGGAGEDTLRGGDGDDLLIGGDGADYFQSVSDSGMDTVADFADGTDLLDLTAFPETDALDALENATDTADGAFIDLPGSTALLLEDIAASDLDISDTTFETTPPPPDTVLEVHRLTLSGTEQVVELAHSFSNPIAIARAPSYNDSTPVAVRISEVTSDTVRLALQRPDYLSGLHPAEEVTLIVAEAGSYRIGDDTILQAGIVVTGTAETPVAFDAAFEDAPAVFTQVQTVNDPDFVITRDLGSDAVGFDVRLQEEEAATNSETRLPETVGWLALSAGTDSLGTDPGTPGAIEVGRLGPVVSGGIYSADFQSDLGSEPGVVTSLASYLGWDPAVLRLPNVSDNGFDVFVQEEQSADTEIAHNPEDVHFLALEGEGTTRGIPLDLSGRDIIGEVMSVSFSHVPQTFEFANTYNSPVAFVGPLTLNDTEAATARIMDVTQAGLTVYAQEPNAYDGFHSVEQATLVVLEAGRHTLVDGTNLEVGTVASSLLTPQGFEQVNFAESFSSAPAIISQVQGRNGGDFVVTRQQEASVSGFAVAMQEEEANNKGFHVEESIGWLAIERGSGEWSGLRFEAGSTGKSIPDEGRWHVFDDAFDVRPQLIAGLSSFEGPDTAILRADRPWLKGFTSFAQEEISLDPETNHVWESVDYVAFEGEGILRGSLYSGLSEAGTDQWLLG